MALQNLNVSSEANSGQGDRLRDAFILLRKMFAEVYGVTYTSDTQDLSTGSIDFKVDANRVELTNTANSGTDGYVLTYDDATGGFTLEQKFDGDITGIVAGSGLTGDASSGEASLAVGAGTGITVNANDVQISDNGVDFQQLAARYTEKETITTTTGTINLDASSYAIFELTGNLGTVQLDINNMKKGQVIDILLTGSDLSSAVITLADNFTTSQINKVGSTSLDTSKKNILQVLCADDNDADAILNYAIATYEADTNPD